MNMSELKREDVKIVDDNPETVLSAMIADYENRTGKTLQPAHIEHLLINTFAYRETLSRQEINEAYRQQHPRFATGQMLDICGDDVATPRLIAQPALTTLRFRSPVLKAPTKIFIPIGTQVSVGELVFETTVAATLSSSRNSVDLPAKCTQTGKIGNGWAIGQINQLAQRLHKSIDVTVANISTSSGGAEIEDDDAYRERILLALESFSVAGPKKAYEYFTRAVLPAIVGVHVGNDMDEHGNPIGGTVAVTILTADGLPSAELIEQVQTALNDETIRPLCDTVIVRAPEVVPYRLNATLVLYRYADVQAVLAAAQSAWSEYETARYIKMGADIVPLAIQKVLQVSGVYNVILSQKDVITIQPNQWAQCVSVSISTALEQVDG